MRRFVRLRSDGVPEITTTSVGQLLGRGDLSLIAALTAAWVAVMTLRLTHLIDARIPIGTLTLVLLRTLFASGTAWLASTLLREEARR